MTDGNEAGITARNPPKAWAKHDYTSWPPGHAFSNSEHCLRCGRHRKNPNFHNIKEQVEERPTPLPVPEVDMSVADEWTAKDIDAS